MRLLRTMALAGFLLAGALAATPAPAAEPAGADQIRQLMMATFDKPEAPLDVGPIVVVDDHAIAGWTQGEMGGRALLRHGHHGWVLALCAGDGLKDPAMLVQAGIAAAEADALAAALAGAEQGVDPARLAKFALFEGVVTMDAEGHHPGAHDAHAHGQGG